MAVKHYYAYVNPYIIQEGDATIASVDVAVADNNGDVYDREFSGNSVRNPIDRANPDAGALIALGRALQRAGARLEKVGNSLNKHDEDVVTERAKSAERGFKKLSDKTDAVPDHATLAEIFDAAERNQPEEGEVYD